MRENLVKTLKINKLLIERMGLMTKNEMSSTFLINDFGTNYLHTLYHCTPHASFFRLPLNFQI